MVLLSLHLAAVPAAAASPDAPLDAAPAVDPAASVLTAGDRADLAAALRLAGVDHETLLGGRERFNLGLAHPRDPLRLPSAEAALHDPLWLPDLVGTRGAALAREGAAGPPGGDLPAWDALLAVASEELGPRLGGAPCAADDRPLLERLPEAMTDSRRARRWLADEVSPELSAAVGALLGAHDRAACRLTVALAGLAPHQREILLADLRAGLRDEGGDEADRMARAGRLAELWGQVDRAALLDAGAQWTRAVQAAATELAALPAEAWPGGPLVLPTDRGEVWLGSPGADHLAGDPILLLDPGGSDHWELAPARDLARDDLLDLLAIPPVRGHLDLGGDDTWTAGDVGPGGALLGLSAGVDAAGDDTLRVGRLGLGAAWAGHATWLDGGGADVFVADSHAQGHALAGVGLLRLAGDGDDTVRAGAWAQGAAGVQGVGILHDVGGDDRYVLGGAEEDSGNRLPGHFSAYGQGFAMGQRPWLGGGLGWLQDDGGHDQYVGGLWVQGGAYWHGLGVLLDRGGNDSYLSDQYSQGSGIHLAAAGLFELSGDDRYLTRYLGQGGGHDLSVTWLIDADGDDVYTGQDTVQGAALTNGVALFLDRAGDDVYAAASDRRWGFTNRARRFGAVAVHVDRGGADQRLAGGEVEALPAAHGVALVVGSAGEEGTSEAPSGQPEGESTVPPEVPATPEEARALLRTYTRWLAPWPDTRAAADRVHAAGPQAVGWVLPLTHGDMHLRSYTVEEVVKRWVAGEDTAGRAEVAAIIAADLAAWPAAAEDAAPRWHLKWLGLLAGVDPALAGLARTGVALGREHPAFAVRQGAWNLAADLVGIDGALSRRHRVMWRDDALAALAADPVPEVRAAAARFLGALGDGGAAGPLAEALVDGHFALRSAAVDALRTLAGTAPEAVLGALAPVIRGPDGPARDAALELVGHTGEGAALALLHDGLWSEHRAARLAGARGLAVLIEAPETPATTRAAALRLRRHATARETDPLVKSALHDK